MPKRRSLLRPSAFCSRIVVLSDRERGKRPSLARLTEGFQVALQVGLTLAARHPSNAWGLTPRVGFDVVVAAANHARCVSHA